MYFEKLEDKKIRTHWNGKLYKVYSSAQETAKDLNMKLNCVYVRTTKHKEQEYIARDYKFTFKINNKESVTTKEAI